MQFYRPGIRAGFCILGVVNLSLRLQLIARWQGKSETRTEGAVPVHDQPETPQALHSLAPIELS